MKTLILEVAAVVITTALLGPATAEPQSPGEAAQERTTVSPALASEVVVRRLSAHQRAELRRQLAEYSRSTSRTAFSNCKPPDTCPSSD
jgi:putative exporter of polyketide antibiotics